MNTQIQDIEEALKAATLEEYERIEKQVDPIEEKLKAVLQLLYWSGWNEERIDYFLLDAEEVFYVTYVLDDHEQMDEYQEEAERQLAEFLESVQPFYIDDEFENTLMFLSAYYMHQIFLIQEWSVIHWT